MKSLAERGITKSSAQRLAQKYPDKLIEQRIEVFDWLVDSKSPLVGRNPPGYLRKSTEEDREAPKGLKPKAQREAEHAARGAWEKKLEQQQEQESKEAERRRVEQEAKRREGIIRKCGADVQLWEKALESLESVGELGLDYRMLKESILLPLESNVARLVVPHDSYRERLKRHEKMVQQAITTNSAIAIEVVQFVSASEVLGGEAEG